MSIAATGKALVAILKSELPKLTSVAPIVCRLTNAKMLEAGHASSDLTLHLYRIDLTGTPRHQPMRPTAPGKPQQSALNLELRYLLTSWADVPETQHEVLEAAMTVFEHNATLSGANLAAGGFEAGAALRITLESLSTEDMMRIWDSVTPTFRLSVPYVVRTVRLKQREEAAHPMVDVAALHTEPRR